MLCAGVVPFDSVEQWKRNLTILLRDKDKQELISKEKKDRRNFEKISALASKVGLYSHLYVRVLVVSKIPLPNYRFDLDDKRPQREVTLPLSLLRRVESFVSEFLSQKSWSRDNNSDVTFSRSSSSCSIATKEGLFEAPKLELSLFYATTRSRSSPPPSPP
ncbi:DExH-box ATP-dependent RNA helicase DExH5, mitochondrial-like isoform X2 [Cannabis sativa]|uniref:DExH-box ATP-dependent RNA helicase DExH5, mitochondrial-like isoform X2 n=1 Tax=Cannabis sativa TaxID=3483 RepID=UPI0029CA945E|nr:DExH-box ATP-dependent RNA helicase DExH5, mitochondrial-like isoform X2 [Cannabis sativa]